MALAACLCSSLVAGVARAQDAPGPTDAPSAQQRQAAADAFDRGTAAFLAHDYAAAAQWFETANRMAPAQPAILWAVKAHARAGDTLRAATLALRLREMYGEADHATARAIDPILESADRRQVRVDVTCDGCTVELDGTLQESKSFYLEPGAAHAVIAHFETGDATQSVTGAAGDHRALAFTAPAAAPDANPQTTNHGWPATARRTSGSEPPPPAWPHRGGEPGGDGQAGPEGNAGPQGEAAPGATPARGDGGGGGGGISPVVFGIGAGLTAVAGGILIWSAIDMYAGVGAYNAMPTLEAYDAGHATEIRTMVLEGVTGGLAAVTILLAIFTNWGGGGGGHADHTAVAPLVFPGGAGAAASGTF